MQANLGKSFWLCSMDAVTSRLKRINGTFKILGLGQYVVCVERGYGENADTIIGKNREDFGEYADQGEVKHPLDSE